MYIKNTEQCDSLRFGRLAIKRPALNKLRHHIVVVLCSLWVSAPVLAADAPLDAVPLAGGQMTVATKPVEAIMQVSSTAVTSVSSVALAVAAVGSVASKTVLDAAGVLQHGIASWYGERFQNKRTANGERFNMNALTAAHPTLPFGTRLCAHSPKTGKSVIVRINDRGPFVKHRIIDFSKAAAQALGILHSRPDVVALLDSSDKRCEKG
ncbi:septal ring lytic transglycosylase RlpA family protein [Rhodoferax sp.]|jgi:rare lipoprotein A|uniref:septal ring lytic transglycosylase RlpA family protein n=1 Tax=Rhodoferax sp. TaxID=50421 RepID=UPI00273012D4|nr:septal ring lytic transglycosylase RlpA family protein [Rhodoferax sp.]MDP2441249.1 septal ring lytic transglycosylase RlpA family protein [Rhodoferax sp.]MDZ4207906.1 septal ring lytic transglycosylase RlpA family protein [Rhodoferax sp.]